MRCLCNQALVFGEGDHMSASTDAEGGMRFLLIAGQPIKEAIVQHGPFVMNTQVDSFPSENFGRGVCFFGLWVLSVRHMLT